MKRILPWLALLSLPIAVLAAEPGDLNGDGHVDSQDIQLLDGYLDGTTVLQDSQIAAADADGDKKITGRDRDILKRRVEGLSLRAKADTVRDGGRGQIDLQSADSGVVVDKQTGQPLAGVEVSLPDEGITVRTDSEGRFSLPHASAGKILTARASNYAPTALSGKAGAGGYQLQLERLSPRLQVLDDELHHLGDDQYGRGSANASDFRLHAEGTAYTRNFTLRTPPTGDLLLRIGSVIGLDTPQSAAAGQTQVSFFGTEQDGLKIYLNGSLVSQVYVNADNIAVKLPRWLLQPGSNQLRLETHVFSQPAAMSGGGLMGLLGVFGMGGGMAGTMAGNVIDYDDLEFAHFVLEDVAGRVRSFDSRGEVSGPRFTP